MSRYGSSSYLQHLPDFKGIETVLLLLYLRNIPCSTSLTPKGSILKSRPVNVYRPAFYMLCQRYNRSNMTLLVAVVRVNVLWPTGGIFSPAIPLPQPLRCHCASSIPMHLQHHHCAFCPIVRYILNRIQICWEWIGAHRRFFPPA